MFKVPTDYISLWLLFTIGIFWFGPIDWPLSANQDLIQYQLIVLLGIFCSRISSTQAKISKIYIYNFNKIDIYLAVALILGYQYIIYAYTDKSILDFVSTIQNQNIAYREMLDIVYSGQGKRIYENIIKILVTPAYLFLLAKFFLSNKKKKFLSVTLILIALSQPIFLSVFRGTDKELGEVIIMVGIMWILCLRNLNSKIRFLKIISCITVIFFFAFTYRKYLRYESFTFCAHENLICYSEETGNYFIDFLTFGIGIIDFYLTNGYYGLSLALSTEFESSLGIGHSFVTYNLYKLFCTDCDLIKNTYIYKTDLMGWPIEYYWHTALTWIANDIGFILTIPLLIIFSRFYNNLYNSFKSSNNIISLILFSILTIFFIYIPMNNQILQTNEMYFTTVLYFTIYAFKKIKEIRFTV